MREGARVHAHHGAPASMWMRAFMHTKAWPHPCGCARASAPRRGRIQVDARVHPHQGVAASRWMRACIHTKAWPHPCGCARASAPRRGRIHVDARAHQHQDEAASMWMRARISTKTRAPARGCARACASMGARLPCRDPSLEVLRAPPAGKRLLLPTETRPLRRGCTGASRSMRRRHFSHLRAPGRKSTSDRSRVGGGLRGRGRGKRRETGKIVLARTQNSRSRSLTNVRGRSPGR